MYVTKEEYAALGYFSVLNEAFARYEAKAEAIVRRCTFDRISDADMRPGEEAEYEVKRIAEMNQRGVCELMDVFYAQDQDVIGESGAAIKSFSNEGYSETLDSSKCDETAVRQKVLSIVCAYFTPEQRYRGFP